MNTTVKHLKELIQGNKRNNDTSNKKNPDFVQEVVESLIFSIIKNYE